MHRIRRQPSRIVRHVGILFLAGFLPAAAQTPAGPVITPNGIVNAADYTREAAPGTMVAVFGSNLAPNTTAAATVPLPKSLEGVSVEVLEPGGSWPAVPLYFVSATQINIQLPFLAATTAQLRVRTSNGVSPAVAITLIPHAPRIFTRTMDGQGEPTLFHSRDFSWVTAAAPAVPGEYLVLLLTGLGAVTPLKDAGTSGGDNGPNGPLNNVPDPVFVSFGGTEVPAVFAGLMPGFPGVYQVNFQVPDAITDGLQTIQVRTGAVRSQLNVAAFCARYAPGAVTTIVPPSGGALATTGASITLPAGLFPEPTTVAVSRAAVAVTPVDPWRASDVYTVNGLPAILNVPVTVTIDLTRRAASGETLVALASGPGVRGSGLEFLEATVTGSQATVTLPAADSGGAKPMAFRAAATPERAAESGPEVSFYVMTFYRRVNVGDFLLFFPADTVQEADVNAVAGVLQQTKSQLVSLGLNWDRRTRWPLRVVIYPFTGTDAEKWGVAEPSILGLNFHSISINANKLSAGVTDDLKATIGHELFHILQSLYDPRDAFRIAKVPGSWLWFQEAASTWFESVAIGDRDRVPAIVEQDNYAFLSGHGLEFQPGDPGAVQNHGYGASMFLHYLAGQAGGNAVIGSILKEGLLRAPGILAQSARWPVEGAAAVLPGMLSEHWRNFVIAYAEGSLYGNGFPNHSQILSQLKDRLTFTDQSTAGKTFSWDAPALSAAFYLARFQAWPKDVKLTISLADPGGEAQLSVYRVRGDSWTLVTRMRAGEYDFPKPEELVANNESLVLAVANANGSGRYTGSTAIGVGVNKAVDSIVPLLRNMTRFGHTLYGILTYSATDVGPNMIGPFFPLPGLTWNGTSFSATADDSALVNAGEPPFKVTLSGTVSPDGLQVTSAHFKRYRLLDKQVTDSSGRVWRTYEEKVYEWDAGPLPVDAARPGGFTATTDGFFYEVKGAASNAAINGFVYKTVTYDGWASDFSPSKLITRNITISFPADDRFYVQMVFYK